MLKWPFHSNLFSKHGSNIFAKLKKQWQLILFRNKFSGFPWLYVRLFFTLLWQRVQLVTTSLLSFEAGKLEFFLQMLEVFFQGPLSFFKNPEVLKIQNQFFEKMTVFGGKSVRKAPNMAFFGALRAHRGFFCSFTTIATVEFFGA